MNSIKYGICAAALTVAATHASATIYPLTVNSNIFIVGLALPVTATGYYDDVTGSGSWTMTVDLGAVGAPVIQYDQTFTMDAVTGNGFLDTATNCGLAPGASGDPLGACLGLAPAFTGPLNGSPTPIAAGNRVFALSSPFGSVSFDVVLDSDDPAVQVALDIAASTYECVNEGALVEASSSVTLLNGAELESLAWSVDGQPVASTESISEYLSLGQHTLEVVATITTGDFANDQVSINVVDTVDPVISAFFTDSRTGDVVTAITANNTSFILANFGASDDCDNNPQATAFGGFTLSDGQALKIQGNQGKVELTASQIEMQVNATDSSGNSSAVSTALQIQP